MTREMFPDPKRMEMRLDGKFMKRMDRWCKKNYSTRSALVRRAVDWFLRTEDKRGENDG